MNERTIPADEFLSLTIILALAMMDASPVNTYRIAFCIRDISNEENQ